MFNDSWPTFDRKGEYLFCSSNRNFTSPVYEDIGSTFVYADTDTLFVVPLRDEVGSPWAPKSDEEKWGEEKKKEEEKAKEKEKEKAGKKEDGEKKDSEKKDDKDKKETDKTAEAEKKQEAKGDKAEADADKKDEKKDDAKKDEPKPVVIELDGFERRLIALPVPKGNFTNIAVNHEGKLIYVRGAARGLDVKPSVKIFDLTDDEKKEKGVVDEVGQFVISADGKKLLVKKEQMKEQTYAIIDAAPEQKLDKPLALSDMAGRVDPRAEWRQMFHEPGSSATISTTRTCTAWTGTSCTTSTAA
jgi:tricorn protease